jgi:hypothetical protein
MFFGCLLWLVRFVYAFPSVHEEYSIFVLFFFFRCAHCISYSGTVIFLTLSTYRGYVSTMALVSPYVQNTSSSPYVAMSSPTVLSMCRSVMVVLILRRRPLCLKMPCRFRLRLWAHPLVSVAEFVGLDFSLHTPAHWWGGVWCFPARLPLPVMVAVVERGV